MTANDNDKGKRKAREEINFRLEISASQAATLQKQDSASGEQRGKSYGPNSLRLPNPAEELQLSKSGDASLERR
jgi:hypothetical protein